MQWSILFSALLFIHITIIHGVPVPDVVNCSLIAEEGGFVPYTLKNKNGLQLQVIRFGGTVTHFLVPDKEGVTRDIILGFDDPTQYCANATHPYFGAIIGRYANRIENGTFELDGKTYHTPLNDHNWDTLHGGTIGYDRRLWTVIGSTENSLSLSLFSPDGEMGFPGNLWINATYTLTDSNQWVIDYIAYSDQDTIINLSQHTYWNLNGFANNSQQILDHLLFIDGNQYALTDSHLIPTGVLGNVTTDFWMDFLQPKAVGQDIKRGTVTPYGGYDNAFVLRNNNITGQAMSVFAPMTGIAMEMYTTQVSVQFYSGNFLNGTLPRKQDQVFGDEPQYYQLWSALVFEAQAIPDSIHHPQWPSTILPAGKIYNQTTIYQISV